LNDRLNEGDLYGDGGPRSGFWAMGFGSWADMDAAGFTTGFDADSFGGGAGFDFNAAPNVLVGASYYYIDTDIDETGPNGASTEMSTHGLLAYLAGRAGGFRAKSSIGFAWNNYETARPIAILSDVAAAEFDGNQFTAHTELGYVLGREGLTFTPVIGFRYVSLETDAYDETGSAGAASVNQRSVESMRGELGLILASHSDWGRKVFSPEAHVRLLNEFLDPDEIITGSYLAGGGPFTVIVNDREDLIINAGGSISLISASGLDIRLGYDGDFGDGFTSHAASLTARLKF
jgi:outer membrane autotransporter protein